MIDPVTSSPFHKIKQEIDSQKATAEMTSLYYLTTLQSLKTSIETQQPQNTQKAMSAVEGKKEEKSFIRKVGDWLWGLFGWSKDETANKEDPEGPISSLPNDHAPKLQSPDKNDSRKLKQTIADLNRDLVYRLKDISEFEEEMRKSSSNQMDKLIFIHIVAASLEQKKLKETASIEAQEESLDLHKKNKGLQKTYYNLLEEIQDCQKTNKVLHWINVGATVGIAGTLAVTFATGGLGAVVGVVALPLLSLVKGGVTLAEGTLKYKNDLRTGELFMINRETKTNKSKVTEKSSTVQNIDQEIGALLKAIRHHLDNQSRAERANFSRTGS